MVKLFDCGVKIVLVLGLNFRYSLTYGLRTVTPSWADTKMNANMNGWMVALVARFGRENVRIVRGMIEKRGMSCSGAAVWHVMGKAY